MRTIETNGMTLHMQEAGDPKGAPVVFANSLGTDLRLWDALIPLLHRALRFIRFDKHRHGLLDGPDGPSDVEGLNEVLGLGPVTFLGLSIGDIIGQCLSTRRPDLVRAQTLSNTAVNMGDPAPQNESVAAIAGNHDSASHSPCVEAPMVLAVILNPLLKEYAYV